MQENAHAPILTADNVRSLATLYLDGADPRDAYASPLFAPDHSDLPPALIQVAEHDPIRDDGLRYAAALESAGTPVRTTTYVGTPHGYMSFPGLCRNAPQALGEICTELHTAFDPSSRPDDGHPSRCGHVLSDHNS